jgi:transposase
MLTLVNPEKRVPANHPIRLIKELAEVALKELSPLFEQMYSEVGRPSIPPERLLKASLLMALYTVRSERMFFEQLDYNLLFRWFLDLNWDEPGFDHSTFSRNRGRLLEHDVAGEFFRTVVAEARELKLTSDEHFTVDGTLIEAWASLKSLRPKAEKPSDRSRPMIRAIRAWTSTASGAETRPTSRRLIPQRVRRKREMVPVCVDQGVGLIPLSPLARGLLGGRSQAQTAGEGPAKRAQTDQMQKDRYFHDDDFEVAAVAQKIAKEHGVTPTQIACAWILQAPGVTAPIIGATKTHHLKQAFEAVDYQIQRERGTSSGKTLPASSDPRS